MSSAFENDFVCVSHVPWYSVRRHPENFPWRFLRKPRILFVEEPALTHRAIEPYLDAEVDPLFSNVTVVRLMVHVEESFNAAHGDPAVQAIYNRLLAEYVEAEHYTKPVLWLSTPYALKFGLTIPYRMLVFGWLVQSEQKYSSVVG